jgi:hypothetical protein
VTPRSFYDIDTRNHFELNSDKPLRLGLPGRVGEDIATVVQLQLNLKIIGKCSTSAIFKNSQFKLFQCKIVSVSW